MNKTLTTSQITTHPAFAVLGVLLGALTSVFTGRLLAIGLPDVQGAIGASADYMTWISTAYNTANMFVGPLTVIMGAIFGARRVLLWASVIFMTVEFLSPFAVHNQIAFVLLQTLAGLAAGTYYPLTFSMIIRNFSLRYLHLGIAVYALDILASTHIAHLVESFYINTLSWHWIFWNALLTTPMLTLCVYFGIPRQAITLPRPGIEYWGFIYAASAFSLIYLALDQGERLDWWHSPLIAAFFLTGFSMLGFALWSRATKPNPMLNLGFLKSRNFLLLGAVLVCYRFLLLEPTLLIPNFLQLLHGYRPEQQAQVLAWVAIPELIFAPLAGLLLYKVDSRLVCAMGFALVSAASFINSKLTPGWTGDTFLVAQMVSSAGLALGLVGLVGSLLRSAMAAGALKNPINILTIGCWFQTCRLFGAEVGKSAMAHFLKTQGDLHYSVLASHISGDWLTTERLKSLIFANLNAGAPPAEASSRAIGQLSSVLKQQVGLLSLSDGFVLVSLVAAVCIIGIGFVSYTPPLVTSKN